LSRAQAQEELRSIIGLCRTVTAGGVEPFAVDVDYILSVIRKHYPEIRSLSEFCTDAEAISELSGVLKRQDEWIQHQSTTLYKDPFLLSQQLMRMEIGAIADSFLRSWHPVLEMEQLSARTLAGSLVYWTDLLPMSMRWSQAEVAEVEAGTATIDEARELGIIPEEGFAEMLEASWRELGEKAGVGGRIGYWDWIGADTYQETVIRSYLACFMVSYGYADIVTDRFGENAELVHNPEPKAEPQRGKITIPTLVDYEEWRKWHRG